jgi:hypothetical protein
VRAGGHFLGNQTYPAVWIFSAGKPFQGIRFSDVDVTDPTYSGLMFQTNVVDGRTQSPITDTAFTDLSISGARRSGDQFDATSGYGILVANTAVGSATFAHLRLSGNAIDVQNNSPTFSMALGTAPALAARAPSAQPTSAFPPPVEPPGTIPRATPPSTTAAAGRVPPRTSPAPSYVNFAAGKSVVESGHTDVYVGRNITDGKPSSYWEGPKDRFPSTLTVDLGNARRVGRLTLALPPLTVRETRREVIAVLGSANGRDFATLAGARSYTFDPVGGNRTTVTVPKPASARYIRLEFRSNSGWPAAQLSELGVFAS